MRPFTPPNRIRYTAQIPNVREVAIYGTADRDCWQTWLQPLGLQPATTSGDAHVIISATALVWQGLRFRELIVTVATTTRADPTQADSFYLTYACNSSPILAWAERALFQTPYLHREVALDTTVPWIEVRHCGQSALRAQLGQPRAPTAPVMETWAGPVFLPVSRPRQQRGGSYFMVAISGEQAVYPFAPDVDILTLPPAGDHPVFTWLRDSHFTPTEWRIRANATHARSQTYRRGTAE